MKVFGVTIGRGGASAPLALGAHPSVDLLPPEVRLGRRSRGMRRSVVALAVLLIVGVAGGGTWAKLQSITAEATLAAEQDRSQALIDRQAEFGDVMAVQAEIDERLAAREVITSTEIDWQAIIVAVRGTLPEDAIVMSVSVDGSSPMEAYAQPTAPLQGSRVATVSFTVRTPEFLSVPDIEDKLAGVLGFVDVQVPSSTLDPVEGFFETSFVVHLSDEAYTGRFPAEVSSAAEQPASTNDATADAEADAEEELQ